MPETKPMVDPSAIAVSASDTVIDGWHLHSVSTGQGVYANRLVQGLIARAEGPHDRVRVAVPERLRHTLSGPVQRMALPLRTPRMGHPLLDQALWQQRLGAFCRHRHPSGALLSPGPFWAMPPPAKTAVTCHDCIYRHFPRYQGRKLLRKWLNRRAEQFLLKACAVFTESHHAKGDICSQLGVDPSCVHVIPAWLPADYDPTHAQGEAGRVRKQHGLPERFWLYVGGYDYRKNVEFLIQAHAAVPTAPPLVLAGTIPTDTQKPVCDVAGALERHGGMSGAVVMPGFIPPADMPGLYSAAELFVYPSLYEGFGLPVLEAMGCGCTTVCADNSSLPEVVVDDDYRFKADDIDALVALLQRAAQGHLPFNPGFRRDAFDQDEAMESYLAVINRLRTPL